MKGLEKNAGREEGKSRWGKNGEMASKKI